MLQKQNQISTQKKKKLKTIILVVSVQLYMSYTANQHLMLFCPYVRAQNLLKSIDWSIFCLIRCFIRSNSNIYLRFFFTREFQSIGNEMNCVIRPSFVKLNVG